MFFLSFLLGPGTVVHWLEHLTHDHKVVGTSPGARCVESLNKILNPHCSSPAQVKKEWVRQVIVLGRYNRLICAGGGAYPTTKITLWSLVNTLIEMDTAAESLELRFRLSLNLKYWNRRIYHNK